MTQPTPPPPPTPPDPEVGGEGESEQESNAECPPAVKALHSSALYNALQVREEFFRSLSPERYQQAMALQQEIDALLANAGNAHNRLLLLQEKLNEQVVRLHEESCKLRESLLDLCEKVKDL